MKLWEQAGANKEVEKIGELTIRIFDAELGFPLLRAAATVPKARKSAAITASYRSSEGGNLEMTFDGPLSEAKPVTEFLGPQLRAAEEKNAQIELTLAYLQGLKLDGPEPGKLTERLSRFVSGSAHVTAKASHEED